MLVLYCDDIFAILKKVIPAIEDTQHYPALIPALPLDV